MDSRAQALAYLRAGKTVVIPTETAYALAADATNAAAVRAVFAVKGRAAGKTLPILVTDMAMAKRYADIPPVLMALARRFWPGPLTIVVPARIGGGQAPALRGGIIRADGTIAIRVSSHPVAQALSRALGRPLVATSANVSGLPTAYSVPAVQRQFAASKYRPDAYLNVGALPRRVPSTIVGLKGGKVSVLRQGRIRSYVPTR